MLNSITELELNFVYVVNTEFSQNSESKYSNIMHKSCCLVSNINKDKIDAYQTKFKQFRGSVPVAHTSGGFSTGDTLGKNCRLISSYVLNLYIRYAYF